MATSSKQVGHPLCQRCDGPAVAAFLAFALSCTLRNHVCFCNHLRSAYEYNTATRRCRKHGSLNAATHTAPLRRLLFCAPPSMQPSREGRHNGLHAREPRQVLVLVRVGSAWLPHRNSRSRQLAEVFSVLFRHMPSILREGGASETGRAKSIYSLLLGGLCTNLTYPHTLGTAHDPSRGVRNEGDGAR